MPELLKYWQQQKLITPLDRHFAIEMGKMHHIDEPLFLLICALLSKQLSTQNSCLVLEHIDHGNPMNESPRLCSFAVQGEELEQALLSFSAISRFDENASEQTPLILEQGRLYLQRYHQFELQVAQTFNRLAKPVLNVDIDRLTKELDLVFPLDPKNENVDWQKIAAATALTKKLAVITGGPGTGKTTTVTKLLFLIQQQQSLNIKLVAPTGKAAARLTESIKASKSRLKQQLQHAADQLDLNAIESIPEDASTLHRLLGVIPDSHKFRYHQDNPLRLDLLVVDEASMVDLPMMHKLLSALPDHARLILLGDQDQLASVEAGAVLADISSGLFNAEDIEQPWTMRYSHQQAERLTQLSGFYLNQFADGDQSFGDCVCMLQHSHRFKGDAGIGLLATAVNQSNLNKVMQVWQKQYPELSWLGHGIISANKLENIGLVTMMNQAVEYYRPYLLQIQNLQDRYHNHETVADSQLIEVIELFNQFRILCASRAGDYGVEGINHYIADLLTKRKLIDATQEFYLGRPIIIKSNDYNLGLFNGDIGIILQDSTQPERLMAHFIQADGTILKVLPARLPGHESCFAMTVHKSQGSEFERVALILQPKPTTAQWQLLTKELMYTGITRARSHFTCLGSREVFEYAVQHATKRASGLANKLWNY